MKTAILRTFGLLFFLAQTTLSIGTMHGTMEITGLTPNISTKKYSLDQSLPVYLKSMYNDQPNMEARKFRIPVKVHVHRKKHEDGSWRMQNYVELPFPIYYDHMRVIQLHNPKCQEFPVEPQQEVEAIPQPIELTDDGAPLTLRNFEFQRKKNEFLLKELSSVERRTQEILEKKKRSPKYDKRCVNTLVPQSFVFIFDNPASEGMMQIHSRRAPEGVIPRHDLFYHFNMGLQLYFHTHEENDLVARFDNGDLMGNQFSAILHSLEYPNEGHFKADFFISKVDRIDTTHEEQIRLVGQKKDDDFDQKLFVDEDYSDDELMQQFRKFEESYTSIDNMEGLSNNKIMTGHEGYLLFKEFQQEEHIQSNPFLPDSTEFHWLNGVIWGSHICC